MSEINQILASNLRHFMVERGVKQAELGAKAGIGQTTVSLYLNPDSRQPSTSGSTPSPTLAKVESLADALEVELWELLRPLTLTPAQRELYRSIERAFQEAVHKATSAAPPLTLAASTDAAPTKRERPVVERRITIGSNLSARRKAGAAAKKGKAG